MGRNCPACGFENLHDGGPTCEFCGEDLEDDEDESFGGSEEEVRPTQSACPACGFENFEEGGTCEFCGEALADDGAIFAEAARRLKEAAAAAVAACGAEEPCRLCGDDFAEEGVVRGCRCEAFAHLSCLASQAATAVSERGDWAPWSCCDVCHQRLKGPALLAMGRACWKLYAPLTPVNKSKFHGASHRRTRLTGLCTGWRTTTNGGAAR